MLIKSNKKYPMLTAVLLSSFSLSGCDALFDHAIDCIDNDGPVLNPSVLPNPILNQVYDERVLASIKNEPNDNRFKYEFSLLGTLPEGMQSETGGREIRLFGTPTELGDFNFTIDVEILDDSTIGNDTSGLCFTFDRNEYRWSIQTM